MFIQTISISPHYNVLQGITPHAAVEAMAEGLGRVDGIILDSPMHSLQYALQSSYLISTANYLLDLQGVFTAMGVEFDNPKVDISSAQPISKANIST